MTRQDKTRQHKTIEIKASRGNTRQGKAGQDKKLEHNTKQDYTTRDKKRQDQAMLTRQDKKG